MHLSAFVEAHVSVAVSPTTTDLGSIVMITVGSGAGGFVWQILANESI